MTSELVSAKLLAPYFGSSLYVWASILAVTLGGLAIGYFAGGHLASHASSLKLLMCFALGSALYMTALPQLSWIAYRFSEHLPFVASVVGSSFVLIFPPVCMMGALSPMIIGRVTGGEAREASRTGEVFAVSTVGGIAFTLFSGFYSIPHWGLQIAIILSAIPLLLIPLMFFIFRRKFYPMLFSILFLGVFFSLSGRSDRSNLYTAEGLMGKIEVRDLNGNPFGNSKCQRTRVLFTDNIIQTAIDLGTGSSCLDYTKVILENLKKLPEYPKNALCLGLGGGILSSELQECGVQVTAVEMDPRMMEIAKRYFHLNSKVTLICDDARNALRKLDQKFDLIVIDLFSAEVTPWHVLTLESFAAMEKLLSPRGNIVINTYGNLSSESGRGNAILLKTLLQEGFYISICYSGLRNAEDYRNLEIFAGKAPIPRQFTNQIDEEIPSMEGVSINSDLHPTIEFENAKAIWNRRKAFLMAMRQMHSG